MAVTIADREAEFRLLRYVETHDARRGCDEAVDAVCATGVSRATVERALWHLIDVGRIRLGPSLRLSLSRREEAP